jgi:CRISPR-associated Csx14 family protein
MRNVLVSSLGWTPAVVTEVVDLLERERTKMDEVVVFPTSSVLPSFYALLIDFKYGPYNGKKRIERRDLPFDDIRDEGDCEAFRRILAEVIDEKQEEGERVFMSVAGGRKTMPLDMMLVARRKEIKEVYHVIAEEVRGISNEFSAIQKIFDLKGIVEGKTEAPREIIDFIVKMCHPEKLTLRLIRIPTE